MANKYLDLNGVSHLWEKIVSKINSLITNKVDKVDGKGLSTNDFTDVYQSKLESISSGAQVNVQSDWSATEGDAFIKNKPTLGTASAKDIGDFATAAQGTKAESAYEHSISTHARTDATKTEASLTNGNVIIDGVETTVYTHPSAHEASMITQDATHRFVSDTEKSTWNSKVTSAQVQTLINESISGLTGVNFEVVTELPTTGVSGVFYLVANGSGAPNQYKEYVWIESKKIFECLGDVGVDLTGYLKATDMVSITNSEIDSVVV